jgi:nucleoside-diphosphate-sugar epimerase
MPTDVLARFTSEEELEAFMTHPSEALIGFMSTLSDGLLVLGAGGKMGGTLCRMARYAAIASGNDVPIVAVSRFSHSESRAKFEDAGVETVACDLMNRAELSKLPTMRNIVYMVGRKFGSTDDEPTTWAMNAYLPGLVAERFPDSRHVVFSTGNVYPFSSTTSPGADETTRPDPVGEYAQSCLARERVFQYFSEKHGTPVLLIRLNYAVEMRYGVLADLAGHIMAGEPIDLSMSHVNVIWQGDACDHILRSLVYAASPAAVLNVTGTKAHSVRDIAEQLGRELGLAPKFIGQPQPNALLADSSRAASLLGAPTTSLDAMIRWTARWLLDGGTTFGKPTHFSERRGRF